MNKKIKCHPLTSVKDVFIADKDSLKSWLNAQEWTEIHEFRDNSGLHGGQHVPIDQVMNNIDQCQKCGVFIKEARENHKLSLLMDGYSLVYYIGEISRADLDIKHDKTTST